jgi:hypothetical protein
MISNEEKKAILEKYPKAECFLKRFISGDDFINNRERWCIWLKKISPEQFREIKIFQERFLQVEKFRHSSSRLATQKMANYPYLFAEDRQPDQDFLLIPKVSSENRKYIPIAYLTKDFIISDKTFVVPNAHIFDFGILTSYMHMTWVKYLCGRLKSDLSYSNTIVYNNFPFPENITDKQKQKVETCAQKVLDTRAKYPDSSLADLYDRLTMPSDLTKAHQNLDKAVDLCYRPQPFVNELNRIEYLFNLYENLTAPLLKTKKPTKGKNKGMA